MPAQHNQWWTRLNEWRMQALAIDGHWVDFDYTVCPQCDGQSGSPGGCDNCFGDGVVRYPASPELRTRYAVG